MAYVLPSPFLSLGAGLLYPGLIDVPGVALIAIWPLSAGILGLLFPRTSIIVTAMGALLTLNYGFRYFADFMNGTA